MSNIIWTYNLGKEGDGRIDYLYILLNSLRGTVPK